MPIITDERWRNRFKRYAPLFFWMILIFVLSSNVGSMSNTSRFIRPLLRFIFPDVPEDTLAIYHGYIRKMAHVTEYAILAFLALRAFFSSSVTLLRKHCFASAFFLVCLVALLDELNQGLIASRTSSPKDVILDCIGGLVAIFVSFFFSKRKKLF